MITHNPADPKFDPSTRTALEINQMPEADAWLVAGVTMAKRHARSGGYELAEISENTTNDGRRRLFWETPAGKQQIVEPA